MKSINERFEDKVVRITESGCWVWVGALMPNGYGYFRCGKKTQYAHRVSYVLSNGEIPKGLVIDHLCRCRSCVNPSHLEAVTQRENLLRGDTLIARQLKNTHCPQGHELTLENLSKYKLKLGTRYCLTCHREREQKRRAKKLISGRAC